MNTTGPVVKHSLPTGGGYSLIGTGQGDSEVRDTGDHSEHPFTAGKKEKRKENLRDPGPPVVGGQTPGCPNTILVKRSNPEVNISEGLNLSLKGYGWGL